MSDIDILKASKFVVTGRPGYDERAITFELPMKKGDKGHQVLVIRDFLGVSMFESDVFDDVTKDSLRKWQLQHKEEISSAAGLAENPANPNQAQAGWFSEFGVVRPATFVVMMRQQEEGHELKKLQESAQRVLEYLDTKADLIKGNDQDSTDVWSQDEPSDFDQPPRKDNKFVYVTWISQVSRGEVSESGYEEFVESTSELALRSAIVKAFSFYNKSPIWKPAEGKNTWKEIMDFQEFPEPLRNKDDNADGAPDLQFTIIPVPTAALAESVPTVDVLYGQDLRERAKPIFAAIKKIHGPSERPGSKFKFSIVIRRELFDPIPQEGTLQELPTENDIIAAELAKSEMNQSVTEGLSESWLGSSKEDVEKLTSMAVERCLSRLARDAQIEGLNTLGLDKDDIRAALRDQLLAKAEQHLRDINTESFPACREYALDALLAGKIRDEHGNFLGKGLIQTVATRMDNYEIQMSPWRLVGGRFKPRLKVPREARDLRAVIGAVKEFLRINAYVQQPGDKIRFCFDEVKRYERMRPLGPFIPGVKRSLQPFAVAGPKILVTAGLKVISAHIIKINKEEIELTAGSRNFINERPWNSPRTMGYLFNLDEMYKIARNSNFCSTTPPMSGTEFFKRFTVRTPALKTVFLFNEFASSFDKFAGPIKTAAQKIEEDLAAASSGAWKATIITEEGLNIAAITDKLPADAACTLEGLFGEFLDIFDFGSLFCNFAGCIPDLPWPLEFNWDFDFKLPMLPRLPTFDPLSWLLEQLILMIISIILGFLCGLVRAILDILKDLLSIPGFPGCKDLLDVGTKDICELLGPEANTRAACIDKGVDCLEKMNIPVEFYSDIADLFDEVSLVLTPSELCALLGGNPTAATLGIIKELIIKTKPTLRDYLNNESEIEQFFSCMGDLIDPNVCKKISRLSNVVISDEVCPEKEIPSLRQRLKDLGASPEEIKNALADAARKRDALKDLFNKDPLEDVLPQVGCPAQGGLPGPYDNSNTDKLNNIAVKTALNALEMAYRQDIASFVPAFFEPASELPGADDMDTIEFAIHMNLMKQMEDLEREGKSPEFRSPTRSSSESDWVASKGKIGNVYKPYLYHQKGPGRFDEETNPGKLVVLATPMEHMRHGFPIRIHHPGQEGKSPVQSMMNILQSLTAYRSTIEDGKLFQERLSSRYLPGNQVRKTKISPTMQSLMKSNFTQGYSWQDRPPLMRGDFTVPTVDPAGTPLSRENITSRLRNAPKRGESAHGLVVVGTTRLKSLEEVGELTADDVAYQEIPIKGFPHSIRDCFNIISYTVDTSIRAEDREDYINYKVKTTNLEIPASFLERRQLARDIGDLDQLIERPLRAPAFSDIFLDSWIQAFESYRDRKALMELADSQAILAGNRPDPRAPYPFWNYQPMSDEKVNLRIAHLNSGITGYAGGNFSLLNSGDAPRRDGGIVVAANKYNQFYYAQATAFVDAIAESISESRFFDLGEIEDLHTRLVAAFVECVVEPCQGPMGNEGAIVPATAEKPCIKKNNIALDFEQLRKDILKAYNESLCEPENDPVTRDFTKPGPLENAISDQMIYIYILSFALDFIMKGLFLFSRFDGEAILKTRIVSSFMKDYLETKIKEELFAEEDPESRDRLVARMKRITNEDDFDTALTLLIDKIMKHAKKTLVSISQKAFEPEWKSYKEQFFSEMATSTFDVVDYKSISNRVRGCMIPMSDKFMDRKVKTRNNEQYLTEPVVDLIKLGFGHFYLEQYYRFDPTFLAGLIYDVEWLRSYGDAHGQFPGGNDLVPLNAYFGVFSLNELQSLISYFIREGSPSFGGQSQLINYDGTVYEFGAYENLLDLLSNEPNILKAGIRLVHVPPASHNRQKMVHAGRQIRFVDGHPQVTTTNIKPENVTGRLYPFEYILGIPGTGQTLVKNNILAPRRSMVEAPRSDSFVSWAAQPEGWTARSQYTGYDEFILNSRAFLGSPRNGIEQSVPVANENFDPADGHQAMVNLEELLGTAQAAADDPSSAEPLLDPDGNPIAGLEALREINEQLRHHAGDPANADGFKVFREVKRSPDPPFADAAPQHQGISPFGNFSSIYKPRHDSAAVEIYPFGGLHAMDGYSPAQRPVGGDDPVDQMTPTPIFHFEKGIECLTKLVPILTDLPEPGSNTAIWLSTGCAAELAVMSYDYKIFLLKENFGIEPSKNDKEAATAWRELRQTTPAAAGMPPPVKKWALVSEPSEDIKYLFEFIFPLDRYASLYAINHVTILDRNEELAELFDGTRAMSSAILRMMQTPPGVDDNHPSLDGGGISSALHASQGSEGPLEEIKEKLKDIWPMIKKAMKMAPIMTVRNTANFLDPAYKDMNKMYKKDPCSLRKGLTMGSVANKGVVNSPFPFTSPRSLTKKGQTPCVPGGALPLYVPINRCASDIGKSIVPLILAMFPAGIPWLVAGRPITATVKHLINTSLGTEILDDLGAGGAGKYGSLLWIPGYLGLIVPETPGEAHKKKHKEFQCTTCNVPGRPMQPPPLCVKDMEAEEE